MKILGMITAMAFTISMVSCANAQDAPQIVKSAFSNKFPTAKSVKWSKESDDEWEAEFKMNGTEYSANFTPAGEWKETEHEIAMKDVPQTVQNALNTSFASYKVDEPEICETSEGMVYEFEMKKDGQKMEVAFDSQGKVVKKEMKEDSEGNAENETDDED